jgi:hypothetical protein
LTKPDNNSQKATITSEDADKLGLPTSLDDIFAFGEEGKTIADVISMIIGGDKKDDLSIIQRTNLSKSEASIVADTLVLARFGLILDNDDLNNPPKEWAMPWLRDDVVFTLRGRTSVDFNSIEKAVEALQSIKLKVESQKQTTLNNQ